MKAPSLKPIPLLLLLIAWSAFCKALEVALDPWGYPGASISPQGQHCLYRSIEALDVPHPEEQPWVTFPTVLPSSPGANVCGSFP